MKNTRLISWAEISKQILALKGMSVTLYAMARCAGKDGLTYYKSQLERVASLIDTSVDGINDAFSSEKKEESLPVSETVIQDFIRSLFEKKI